MKIKNKGFSLIELLLVLGVISALAISAFVLYPKLSSSMKSQEEISNLNTIKAGIKSIYKSSPDYIGLTSDVLIDSKIIPDKMIDPSGYGIINGFKGSVEVLPGILEDDNGNNYSGFLIVYRGVPQAECVKIVSATASHFYSVVVNEATVKHKTRGSRLSGGPEGINSADLPYLTESCSDSGYSTNGTATLEFTSE